MEHYGKKIRERAKELLESGKVEVFLGYRKGTVPMMNHPVLIRDPEQASMLHWDSHCGLNLCNYLTKRTERIGVIANGCNSRSLVTHIVENQVKREQVYVLGIPCTGMVDHRAVARAVGQRDIVDVEEAGEEIRVRGADFEQNLKKKEVLQRNCVGCTHPNPVIYDEMLGEAVEEPKGVRAFGDVESIEGMSAEKKWGFFTQLISRCLRCYACRNACPLCYCPTCFVDESRPQWVGKSVEETDTMTFHLLRAYHCAGRCTDCGACERVCPVGIPMRQFTKKLNKDAKEYFSWEAGLTLEERPPLDTYRPDDYNEFVK